MEIISSTVVAFSRVWYHLLHQNSKFESVSDGRKTTVAQKGQSQISLPKHKSIFQNINQFTKTQNNFPKHKSIFQNTNQFTKTQNNFPKHKSIFQNTNQFTKTQINFSKHKPISSKHKSKDWALALLLSESLERTHSQNFPHPTWRLQICCR